MRSRVVRKPRAPKPESVVPEKKRSTVYSITDAVDLGLFSGTKQQVLVGVDPSLTAFAVTAYSFDHGTAYAWLIKPKIMGVNRLLEIESRLTDFLELLRANGCGVMHVAMEGYSFGSKSSHSHALGECGAMAKRALAVHFQGREVGYPTIVAPQSLKKFVTGKGNSAKNEVLLHVFKKWGVELKDDNVADAYALARVAAALHSGETATAYERDVVDRLDKHTEYDQWHKWTKASSMITK